MVGIMPICGFSLVEGLMDCILAGFLRPTKSHLQAPKSYVWSSYYMWLKDKNLILYSCLALVQQGVQMSTTLSFTNQVIQELGATNMVIGYSSIIYMLSAVSFAKLASTKFLELLTKKQWIYISFLLLGIYCLCVPLMNSIILICLLQLIPGIGTGILFSLLTTEAMQFIPQQKRSTAWASFLSFHKEKKSLFKKKAS